MKQRVVKKWQVPSQGVRQADNTMDEMKVLFDQLPMELSTFVMNNYGDNLADLNEIYLQLGQIPECVFVDPNTAKTHRVPMGDIRCEEGHIGLFASFFVDPENDGGGNNVASIKRKGISGTLHRVSLITHPMRTPQKVIGVAVRVGRAMQGLLDTMAWKSFLADMASQKQSLLIIGKPGVGKTTVIREIACTLANDPSFNVVVVDKTCEIAGDGDTPHPAIGRARWMPVGRPNLQHIIMREAVENQSPDVIIVDEISTPQEVDAAKTIAQRGVQLIATVHGETLPEIINCKERGSLTGGVATVTLSGREADRRPDKRKQVQKRAKEPVFKTVLELHTRKNWVYHPNLKTAADSYFENEQSDAMELQPGMAISVKAIPKEGYFEYCRECGMGYPCSSHLGPGFVGNHHKTTTGGGGGGTRGRGRGHRR